MSRLRKNVFTNLLGNVWSTLLSLLFVPIYIHYVGIEAWGLIGFFATLQAILVLADLGLSTTLNREFARTSAEEIAQRRDLLRTLEIVYWGFAVVAGGAVIVAAPYLAAKWLHVKNVPIATARLCIAMMGIVTTLQLPLGLYTGGLLGLQQQVRLNVTNMVMWTIRSVGSLTVLSLISPTITAYFWWQVLVSAAHTMVVGIILWRALGKAPSAATFRRELLAGIWRFSAGMMAISVTSTLLTQVDKVVLSRVLSLETFGYYALAALVASGMYRVMNPVFVAFFPRITQMLAAKDEEGLRAVYHAGSQLATVLLVPAAAVIAAFSYEVLLIWTRNPVTAKNAYVLVALLTSGTAIGGFNYIPYALQLASGWIRLPLYTNIICCALLVPLIIVLALNYGAVGAAAAAATFNLAALTVGTQIMHRQLLLGELQRYYIQDVARPALAAIAVVLLGRLVYPSHVPWMLQLAFLGIVFAASTAAAVMSAPATRDTTMNMLRRFRRGSGPPPTESDSESATPPQTGDRPT